MIHRKGPRADAAFVDVNCAAIPTRCSKPKASDSSAVRSRTRGSPSRGSAGRSPGTISSTTRTDAGTVAGQAPQGDRGSIGETAWEHARQPADAWVIAATSEDLGAAIGARLFCEDLYHRLAVVTVQLPPLRERGADILLIARHYLDRASNQYRLPPKACADAEAALMAYQSPGNVRAVTDLMERVALLTDREQVTGAALRLPRTGTSPP